MAEEHESNAICNVYNTSIAICPPSPTSSPCRTGSLISLTSSARALIAHLVRLIARGTFQVNIDSSVIGRAGLYPLPRPSYLLIYSPYPLPPPASCCSLTALRPSLLAICLSMLPIAFQLPVHHHRLYNNNNINIFENHL